jgi:hypothetical protein
MDDTRRLILKIHGSGLLLLGLANAIVSTLGAATGAGPMGFLQAQKIGHVGLLQAYLLAALLGAVLLIGARQPRPVLFDWVGAATHLSILVVYVMYWDLFPQMAPGFEAVRSVALVHIGFVLLEGWAIFGRSRRAPRREVSLAS